MKSYAVAATSAHCVARALLGDQKIAGSSDRLQPFELGGEVSKNPTQEPTVLFSLVIEILLQDAEHD
jgi:hypothetical protein